MLPSHVHVTTIPYKDEIMQVVCKPARNRELLSSSTCLHTVNSPSPISTWWIKYISTYCSVHLGFISHLLWHQNCVNIMELVWSDCDTVLYKVSLNHNLYSFSGLPFCMVRINNSSTHIYTRSRSCCTHIPFLTDSWYVYKPGLTTL